MNLASKKKSTYEAYNGQWLKAIQVVFIRCKRWGKRFPNHWDKVFSLYKDETRGAILVGNRTFARDLELSTEPREEFKTLVVLSWHMQASTFGEISLLEFVRGMINLRVRNIYELRCKITSIRCELKDEKKFREIYDFSHTWMVGQSGTQADDSRECCGLVGNSL